MEIMVSIVIIIAYFLPTFIASNRYHSKSVSIYIINLFFGWTMLGWVVCLAWAFSENNKAVIEKKVEG